MTAAEVTEQPRMAKIGWILLMVVSGLYVLNGVAWFFVGPDAVAEDLAEVLGTTADALEDSFPEAVTGEGMEARWDAIYLTSIGAMSLIAARHGYRTGTQWAWYVTWVLVFTIAAVGANGLIGTEGEIGGFVILVLVLLVLAVVGQLLAGRGAKT